ncbi:MAG: hypothetical protein ACRERC_17845, partial [Candidatus Binatia bacterium]
APRDRRPPSCRSNGRDAQEPPLRGALIVACTALAGAGPSACFDKLSTDEWVPFALSLSKGAEGPAPANLALRRGGTGGRY